MSTQSQRGKVKSATRTRSQRLPISQSNSSRVAHMQSKTNSVDDNLGIFANQGLTYFLAKHVMGNVGEILTTADERIIGVIRAISPSADFGLTYAQLVQKSDKCNKKGVHAKLIPWMDLKMVRIPNVKLSDCLFNDLKTDSEIAKECPQNATDVGDKELIPFFESSDTIKDCLLDQGGFPADEMFETNEKLFSVATTYNPDLREYTTPVDRSAPNFSETEARCAKLAQDIADNPSAASLMDDELDLGAENEEEKFSAVSRSVAPNRTAVRSVQLRHRSSQPMRQDGPVNTATSQLSQTSIQTSKSTSVDVKTNVAVNGDLKPDSNDQVCGVSRLSIQATVEMNSKPVEKTDIPTPVSTCVTEVRPPSVTTCSSTPVTTVEEKVKRSTLDPNAPEFQPTGLSYGSVLSTVSALHANQQPSMIGAQSLQTSHYLPTMNIFTQPLQLSNQAAFIAASQPPMYGGFPCSPQAAHMQQLMTNPASACVPGTVPQHMRGGSLPPSVNQQGFAAPASHNPNMMPQHTQSGVSVPQMMTSQQSLVMTCPNPPVRLSACPSSSISLTRQRSNDSPSTAPHSTTYTGQQTTMSVPAFQPSIYPIAQPNNPIQVVLSGHSPMGFHFYSAGLSGPVSSSALMVSQSSNQQVYPTSALMHMQPTHLQIPIAQSEQLPTPSSTPQQSTQSQPQLYPQQFQEHPHHVQVPPYANFSTPYQNSFLATQQGTSGFYPTAPAMIAGSVATNPAVAASLLPLVGQANQYTAGAAVAHQQGQMDPSLVNAQQMQQTHSIPQPNCQPQQIFQHYPAQLIQTQQLSAAQHLSNQQLPSISHYQSILAAMTGATGGAASQAH